MDRLGVRRVRLVGREIGSPAPARPPRARASRREGARAGSSGGSRRGHSNLLRGRDREPRDGVASGRREPRPILAPALRRSAPSAAPRPRCGRRSASPRARPSPPRSRSRWCAAGAVPPPVDDRRGRRRPARARRAAPAQPRPATSPSSRCRCGRSRSPTSFPTTIPRRCAGGCGFATRSSPTACSALGELPNVRLQRALSRRGGVTRLDRVLSIVHWAWFFEPHLTPALRPGSPPRALPARGAPDGRHLRPRLRALLRGADGAAVVGGRARLHRGAGRPSRVAAEAPQRSRRCAGSWSTSARRSGGRPGSGSTTRSAATRGRRCRRFTSPPR